MKYVNGWGLSNKQSNKFMFKARFGRLTLMDINGDTKLGRYNLTLFNFSIRWARK
jgi:hypothetical protein